MTKGSLIKRIAQKLGYWDYTNAQVLTNEDVREADMLDALNDAYIEASFPEYVKVNPEYYEQEGTWNNWAITSTVNATSTSYTLDIDDASFTSNMVDAIVYNEDLETTAKITAYTDTTTVTLDTEIGDDWDGDTIYVLTGIYTFSGDMTDIYGNPKWAGIKYSSTDTNWQRILLMGERKMYRRSRGRDKDDTFDESAPEYRLTTVDVSDVPTSAIQVRPIPTSPVTGGVYAEYVEKPALLSDDDDVPRFPPGHHKFLSDGAIAEICYGHLDDSKKGDVYRQKFETGMAQLLDSAVSFDPVIEGDLHSRLDYFRRRRR